MISAHFLFIFGGSFDLHLFPYNFFESKSKYCAVNCICWGAKNSMLLYYYVYLQGGTLIFYVLAEQESKKMWGKFDNVTPGLWKFKAAKDVRTNKETH